MSTDPGFVEVGEYVLKRGTCFVARRLEVVTVAGLLWISWCVVGAAFFFAFFFSFFFFERTRPAASMRTPYLIYLSTSNEARPRERSDRGRWLPLRQKGPFIPGCVQGAIIQLVCLSVCMCNIRHFY